MTTRHTRPGHNFHPPAHLHQTHDGGDSGWVDHHLGLRPVHGRTGTDGHDGAICIRSISPPLAVNYLPMSDPSLSECDACPKLITPAVDRAGWNIQSQVREEVSLTAGRVMVRGQLVARGGIVRPLARRYWSREGMTHVQRLVMPAGILLYSACSILNQPINPDGQSPQTGGVTAKGRSGGTGGSSGGAIGSGGAPASCAGLAATCGPSGNDDCCKSLLVSGGTFYRSYDGVNYGGVSRTDKSYPATVADFYLDKYEITLGRYRQFVKAGMGTQANPPTTGAGRNPLIAGSGWNSAWNTNLAANTVGLEAVNYGNWTDTAGSNESMPVNCLDWYTAFAFCAWDGGRLPTEAEWNYAASGGSEQRYYPWSSPATSTTIDDSYAVYYDGSTKNVGSKSPKGDGKWGQSDLAGNVWEWTLDCYSTYPMPCNNCAELGGMDASDWVFRGGNYYVGHDLRSAYRNNYNPEANNCSIGARCARTGP